jgi:CrcB protein
MNDWRSYLWVALGSMIGGVSRFWISGLVAARLGQVFPWNTLLINVSGSFVIGLLGAWTTPEGPLSVCGGYTTFSSFSLQTLNLLQRDREWFYAGANVAGSVIFCLAAVWLGFFLGKVLLHFLSK